ncbi:unnamed protein product [Orchesella dallaii]|uniref:Sodium channel protein Nach n=1 Tax=Orchesella dallaii TaxID=48710 RepID=A0ABP1PUU7_9HEXA
MSIRQKYPNFYQPHESVVLEHAMPSNSSKIFKHTVVPGTKRRTDVSKFQQSDCDIENPNENDEPNTRFIKNQWQNSEVIVFCKESTMHGLKFIVQSKIHFTERLFWILAFLLSFATALYLIYEVWDRQSKVPVIVSFQAKAQHINSLPFPAVTLCSMNRFPKSKVLQLEREAGDPENPNQLKAKKRLSYVRAACNAHPSFAKTYNYAYRRGTQPGTGTNDSLADYEQTEMIDYLLENTMGCGELIRLCKFQELDMYCDELFKPIITDAGKYDFYCPVSDSMGIRYVLHSPLEIPHVLEYASIVDLGKEVLVKVHPDVTNADEDIIDIEQKKRQCWFGDEKKDSLKYYRPYTSKESNLNFRYFGIP